MGEDTDGTIRGGDIAQPCTLSAATAGPLLSLSQTGAGDGLVIVGGSGSGVDVDTANEGLTVERTGNYGLHMGRTHRCAIVVDSGGFGYGSLWTGIYMKKAGWDGIGIDVAGGTGFYMSHTLKNGFEVTSAGRNGVFVSSADSNGVRISRSGLDGVYVCSTASGRIPDRPAHPRVSVPGWLLSQLDCVPGRRHMFLRTCRLVRERGSRRLCGSLPRIGRRAGPRRIRS